MGRAPGGSHLVAAGVLSPPGARPALLGHGLSRRELSPKHQAQPTLGHRPRREVSSLAAGQAPAALSPLPPSPGFLACNQGSPDACLQNGQPQGLPAMAEKTEWVCVGAGSTALGRRQHGAGPGGALSLPAQSPAPRPAAPGHPGSQGLAGMCVEGLQAASGPAVPVALPSPPLMCKVHLNEAGGATHRAAGALLPGTSALPRPHLRDKAQQRPPGQDGQPGSPLGADVPSASAGPRLLTTQRPQREQP